MTVQLITKTELMAAVVAGRSHESFEHSDEGIFDVTLMRRAAIAANMEPVLVSLDQIVPFILENRVAEEERISFFVDQFLTHPGLFDPGMFIHFDAGTDLMIDGTHRALAAHRVGMKHYVFWMFPESGIIRPSEDMYRPANIEWGDPIIDGKIVRRS